MLAIPQNHNAWGIINAEDLLSLMAEAFMEQQKALVSHPKNAAYSQHTNYVTTQNFQALIKPAMVFSGETSIDEFINKIGYDLLPNKSLECLIVDAFGELKGSLDQSAVIKYLATKAKQLSTNDLPLPTPTPIAGLKNLIDAIAMPMKVQTETGQDLYCNQQWQQLISDQRSLNSPKHKANQPHGNSKIKSRHLATTANYQKSSQTDTSPGELKTHISNLKSITQLHLANLKHPHLNQDAPKQQFTINPSHQRIKVKLTSDWNYFHVPLITKSNLGATQDSYLLIIATKANYKLTGLSTQTSAEDSEPIANQLLAKVSHELKSPLTGIVGLSSLLHEQKLGQLNQRQSRYVQLIYSSGKKMMNIVDNLLKLSDLVAQEQLEPELVNLEFLCRQLYQQALTRVQSNSLDLDLVTAASQLRLDIELGTEITLIDKSVLSSILWHLILEVDELCESLDRLDIKINNLLGSTSITVSGHLENAAWSSSQSSDLPLSSSGVNLAIAKYLAAILNINLTNTFSGDRCQFTLLLPKQIYQNQPVKAAKNVASSQQKTENLTILCLYPELEAINDEIDDSGNSNFSLRNWSDHNEQLRDYQHRIIEADSLEQAHTLARIWQLNVIILDSYQIAQPANYLRSLLESKYLAALPLITLDKRTTEAANQIKGLNVYPCLLPAKHRRVEDLMQVIQIATGS